MISTRCCRTAAWAMGIEGKSLQVVDAPHQAFRRGARGRVQGHPTKTSAKVRQSSRAAATLQAARERGWPGAVLDAVDEQWLPRPVNLRKVPAGGVPNRARQSPRRPRRRPAGPLLGLGKFKIWGPDMRRRGNKARLRRWSCAGKQPGRAWPATAGSASGSAEGG
jgi:hypothetical protein